MLETQQALTGHKVILCADDFAISAGVSDAIEQLAEMGHLSATSAIVTGRTWPPQGPRLFHLRSRIAVGLHLNFTFGVPLGAMQKLAPSGCFPDIADLCRNALGRRVDIEEIAAESIRQIIRFTQVVGAPPDFLDGHQHAHALPGVRQGVLMAANESFRAGEVLVRDPADGLGAILQRGVAMRKALSVAFLASGFGTTCRGFGFPTNIGFAGFSNFALANPYAEEFDRFFVRPGPRHLVMCHPGFCHTGQTRFDPIAVRRQEEFHAIRKARWLRETIWRPQRNGSLWSQTASNVHA